MFASLFVSVALKTLTIIRINRVDGGQAGYIKALREFGSDPGNSREER
jgi:hypothetical protein